MMEPYIAKDEPARLGALRNLAILDTPHEDRFDRITRLTQTIFNVPIALVSLVDENRQWFAHDRQMLTELERELHEFIESAGAIIQSVDGQGRLGSDLDRIFDRLYQTSKKALQGEVGLGLGLRRINAITSMRLGHGEGRQRRPCASGRSPTFQRSSLWRFRTMKRARNLGKPRWWSLSTLRPFISSTVMSGIVKRPPA